MIYPSEPVSSVLMCSEIVGFGFSICFSSSAVCLSFDSSILSLSSCCIEINFSLTSYIQFWSISFCSLSSLSLLSGILASLPHTVGHTFLSVLQEHVCLDALSFIFVLVLFEQLCVDLPSPLIEKISDPLSQISNYSPIQA